MPKCNQLYVNKNIPAKIKVMFMVDFFSIWVVYVIVSFRFVGWKMNQPKR